MSLLGWPLKFYLFAWLIRTKPYLFRSLILCKLISYILKLIFYLYQTLPLIWSYNSSDFSLKSKAKNQIHLICKCTKFLCHRSLWNKTQLIPFYFHLLLLITFAIFRYCKCNNWPWVIWIWWGGCGAIWCCKLYCDLGFFVYGCRFKANCQPDQIRL